MADVVIGYDGSPDARRAVDVAARILGPRSAVVVTAWHPPAGLVATPTVAAGAAPMPPVEEELELERRARRTADEGAARARAAGLDAEASFGRTDGTAGTARLLLDIAEEHDAALVVVARRGKSRITSLVLGSVSEAAVRDGRRPVLVVPAGEG